MYIILDSNHQVVSELLSHKEMKDFISEKYGKVEIDEFDSFYYNGVKFTIVRVPNSISRSKVINTIGGRIDGLLTESKEILEEFGVNWDDDYLDYKNYTPLLGIGCLEEDEKFSENMIKIEILRELKINL